MQIDELQTAVTNAQKIVFLTGAGVSTPSGIPDYRSKNGLYTNDNSQHSAEYYLSIDCLRDEPALFYEYMMKNMYYPKAIPNVIHEKQAALTRMNKAKVITQNIDGLYEKAQTKDLLSFHGTLYDVYCLKCGQHVDYHQYLTSSIHNNCGGTLRPNIVLYGEGLNQFVVSQSIAAVNAADLVVIVGTSMRVYPFANLIDYLNAAAKLVVINQEPLDLPLNYTMLQADASQVFASLMVGSE